MTKKYLTLILSGLILSFLAAPVLAYQLEEVGGEVKGDIVLGPTKIELFVDPGEMITKEIMITNRTGEKANFSLEMEDFTGSEDPSQTIIFLGTEKGPYPLKDWIKPEITEFSLNQGQRIHIPVTISVPVDIEPGGHYGVVFAAHIPAVAVGEEKEKAKGQVAIVSRAGVLFFVRVNGDVKEEGQLKDFRTKDSGKYYEKGPISFELFYENKGSVHLSPYGFIQITNVFGRKVGEIELDPWFAMPGSLRFREAEWNVDFLFGKYTASAFVNRGYDNIIDQKLLTFWVIPWKIVLVGFFGLLLLVWLIRWIAVNFEFKHKT